MPPFDDEDPAGAAAGFGNALAIMAIVFGVAGLVVLALWAPLLGGSQ